MGRNGEYTADLYVDFLVFSLYMDLRNGDCLEILKDIPDKSIDLVFADLPYGQVNCKWDCKVDLELLWKELLRVAKDDTTPFFFTCTTKFGYELISSNKKMFRYDLVWAKSNPCGFLQAKKQPMRKHEMIYVFYKKQPAYDISSHKHKFIKEKTEEEVKYSMTPENSVYQPKLRPYYKCKNGENNTYDPPLPTSVIKEEHTTESSRGEKTYGKYSNEKNREAQLKTYDPPLPTSVIKESEYTTLYGDVKIPHHLEDDGINRSRYEPPLPTSLLEVKSIRLKQHSTAKPPDLMKWILKYYSKEGDTILDPTMGSNPMGLACKEMNRNFIGIEKDPDIFSFACDRVEY